MVAECRMLNMKYGVPASAGGMLVILMAVKYFKLAENGTGAPAKAGAPYLLQVALGLGGLAGLKYFTHLEISQSEKHTSEIQLRTHSLCPFLPLKKKKL